MKTACVWLLALALSPLAQAAEPEAPQMSPEEKAMMEAGMPGPQHAQLKAMEGTWDTKVTMWMGGEPQVSSGQTVNTMILDGRFVAMNYTGDFAGEKFSGIGYTGYDNLAKKFVSSWMDSMSTGMYVSYGSYDDASKTYTYTAEWPDMTAPGKMMHVRQTVKIDSPDQHTMGWNETKDGAKEMKTMEIVYTRKK